MVNDYKIDMNTIGSLYNDFSTEKKEFATKTNSLSSNYLFTSGDPTLSRMASNLKGLYDKTLSGYNNIDNWWSSYNDEFNSLEKSFATGSSSVSEPSLNAKLGNMSLLLNNKVASMNEVTFDSGNNNIENNVFKSSISKTTDNLYILMEQKYGSDYVEQYKELVLLKEVFTFQIDELKTKKIELENDKKALEEEYTELLCTPEAYEYKNLEGNGVALSDMPEKLLDVGNKLIELEKKQAEIQAEMDMIDSDISQYEFLNKELENSINLLPYEYNIGSHDYNEYVENYNYVNQGVDLEMLEALNYDFDKYYSTILSQYSQEETKEHIDEVNQRTHIDVLAAAEFTMEKTGKSADMLALDASVGHGVYLGDEYADVYIIYDNMEEEEINLYHYLYATQGYEKANHYLQLKIDTIYQREARKRADEWIERYEKGKASVLAEALGDGTISSIENFGNLFSSSRQITIEEYKRMMIMDYVENNTSKELLYKAGMSVGNMAPSIALGFLNPMLGTASIGLTSGGAGKHYALVNGHSMFEACLYAGTSGLSEAALERLLGGLKGIRKFEKSYAGSIASEMLEEGIQSTVDDVVLKKFILHETVNLDELSSDVLESTIIAAITAGVLNGGSSVVSVVINGKQQNVNVKDVLKIMKDNPNLKPAEAFAMACEFGGVSLSNNKYSINDYSEMYNNWLKYDDTVTECIRLTYEKHPEFGEFNQDAIDYVLKKAEEGDLSFISREYREKFKIAYSKRQYYYNKGIQYVNNIKTSLINLGYSEYEANNIIKNNLEEAINICNNVNLQSSGYSDSWFDQNRGGLNIYGVDQGVMKRLYYYKDTATGMKYDQYQYNRLSSDIKARCQKYSSDSEYDRIKNKLKNEGFSSRDASIIMSGIDRVGACSYADVANQIFAAYKNNPVQFKKDFGFDMYTTMNGKKTLNSAELLTDMYVYLNDTKNGGVLIKNNKVVKTTGESDWNGQGIISSKDQVYLSGTKGINNNAIKAYLKTKNSSLEYDSYILINNTAHYSQKANVLSVEEVKQYANIVDSEIQQGKQFSLGITQNDYKEIKMISLDENRVQSTNDWNEGGKGSGHAVYITGTTQEGFIVSSWGGKWLIPYASLANGGSFIINDVTITGM